MKLIKRSVFWLGSLCLFHVVANIIWLTWDKTPPAWDQAAHIRISILWVNWLSGIGGNWVDIVRQAYGYPPLVTFLGGIWASLVGMGIDQISFINSIFLIGLIGGVYVLGKQILGSEKKAVLAAALLSLFPVVYDISRNMLLDLPLTVWFVWGTYWWIKSDYLRKHKGAVIWGVFLILASLTKLNGFIYFVPMVGVAMWRAFRKDNAEVWLNLVLVGVMFLAGVGWWWMINSQNIFSYLTGLAGAGEKLTDPMNLGEWQTWVHYLRLLFLHQLSPIGTILLVIGLSKIKREEWRKWGTVVVLAVANYVIFTVIKNKDFRFTMPLLPLLAIWWAWGLGKLHWGWIWLTFGYLGWIFVNNSFGFPIKKPLVVSTPTFLAGDVEWVGIDDYPVRSPKKGVWPQGQIVKDLSYKSVKEEKRERVLVLVNIEELNDNNLFLERELVGGEQLMDFGSVGMQEKFESQKEWESYASGFDYVLVGGKEDLVTPYYSVNAQSYKQATEWMWAKKGEWTSVAEYLLPNGGKAYLTVNPLLSKRF